MVEKSAWETIGHAHIGADAMIITQHARTGLLAMTRDVQRGHPDFGFMVIGNSEEELRIAAKEQLPLFRSYIAKATGADND